MERIKKSPLVDTVVCHQCAFGLKATDEKGLGPVKKPIVFMFNSVAILKQLDRKCSGCERHVELIAGRPKNAAVFPRARCRAVCLGVKHQMELDAADHFMANVDGNTDEVEINELWSESMDDGRRY